MEQTPLELYETAYKLHYTEHRVADAVTYYQRLIKEFPDANECAYAAIQLQQIKATDIAEDLSSVMVQGKRNSIFLPVVVILLLLTVLAGGFYLYRFSEQVVAEQTRVSVALNAISKFSRGNHEDALKLLDEMKLLRKDDIMPYELSADIYRQDGKFSRAREEYVIYFKNNPELEPSKNEQWFIDLSDGKKARKKKSSLIKTADNSPLSPPAPPLKKKSSLRLKKKRKKAVPPPPAKSGKGLLLVDPDSISYF